MTRLGLTAGLAALCVVTACHEPTEVPPPTLLASPPSLAFVSRQGGGDPPPQYLMLQRADGRSAHWTLAVTGDWIIVGGVESPTVGDTLPYTVIVRARVAGLSGGTFSGAIAISMGGETRTVPVTLDVGSIRSLTGRWVGVANGVDVGLALTDNAAGLITGTGNVSPNVGPVTVSGSYTNSDVALSLVDSTGNSTSFGGVLVQDNTMAGTLTGGSFPGVAVTLFRQ